MPTKQPKIPCKQPTPQAITTLREYEKYRDENEYPIRVPANKYSTCDYARCLIRASDPKVLKKYLIEKGRFTLKKLMRKSVNSKLMSIKDDYWIFHLRLQSEMKKHSIVLFSEIIDDHTILLLIRPGILPKILSKVLHESPEYDVITVPMPLNLIWGYSATRYTKRPGSQLDIYEHYSCDAHFSFKDASVNFTRDYQDVKRLYDLVMQY